MISRWLRSLTATAALIVTVELGSVAELRAVVDVTGVWRMGISKTFTQIGVTVDDVCLVSIAQTGTTFSLEGSCQGPFSPVTIDGTIDPNSGLFTGSGFAGPFLPSPYCFFTGLQGTGTADGFSGTFDCQPPPFFTVGTFSGGRCGNGQIDAGETCDDGNLSELDCCDATCQVKANGASCDDGNACTAVDTCQGGSCQPGGAVQCSACQLCDTVSGCGPVADGTPCDDADACTNNDRCASGSCSGTMISCDPCLACDAADGCVPAPASGCKQASQSAIVLKDGATDRLTWKWLRGDETSAVELGAPQSTTSYHLCIYDGSAGLLLSAAAPAGPSWAPKGSGWRYASDDLMPNGLKKIGLTPGTAGKSRLLVRGKGAHLGVPPLQPIALPLTVQLKTSSACWQATYTASVVSGSRLFRAKSP